MLSVRITKIPQIAAGVPHDMDVKLFRVLRHARPESALARRHKGQPKRVERRKAEEPPKKGGYFSLKKRGYSVSFH